MQKLKRAHGFRTTAQMAHVVSMHVLAWRSLGLGPRKGEEQHNKRCDMSQD